MIRRQPLSPNILYWRLKGNGGILLLCFKEEGLQCRFWYLTHDSMTEWCCPFSASSAAQLSPGYTILAWGTLGCMPAWAGSALDERSHDDHQTALEMDHADHNARIALPFPVSMVTWLGSPSAIISWASGPTSLGRANRLGTPWCWSLEWSQHALMTKALISFIKHHWVLSGDGNRNCSEVPCSPPTVQTPSPSSCQPAAWPRFSMSCSACAKPRL